MAEKKEVKCNMEKWHDVKTKDDAQLLLETYGWFHDAWITFVQYESGILPDSQGHLPWDDDSLRKATIVFQHDRSWKPSSIKLEFTGVQEFHINGYNDYDWIGEGNIWFFDRAIVWADVEEDYIHTLKDLEGVGYNYIIADALRWKIVKPKERT